MQKQNLVITYQCAMYLFQPGQVKERSAKFIPQVLAQLHLSLERLDSMTKGENYIGSSWDFISSDDDDDDHSGRNTGSRYDDLKQSTILLQIKAKKTFGTLAQNEKLTKHNDDRSFILPPSSGRAGKRGVLSALETQYV